MNDIERMARRQAEARTATFAGDNNDVEMWRKRANAVADKYATARMFLDKSVAWLPSGSELRRDVEEFLKPGKW